MRHKFSIAGLGGTFDHFHKGHEGFLKFAAGVADYLIIGITTDELLKSKKYPELIQPRHERVKQVKRFCQDNHIAFEIIELKDPYGPTIERDTRIETVVVTEETVSGADKINEIRRGMRAPELPVHVFDMVKDERGRAIHSADIRAGEISREGVFFGRLFENDFKLEARHREFFSKLQGVLVKEPNFATERICLVGDSTWENFVSHHWEYDLAVYDQKTQREKVISPLIERIESDLRLDNPPGFITAKLFEELSNWSPGKFRHLLIGGEEDLATVALVLCLPLYSHIYYGQPNQGLVELKVTEKTKMRFFEALSS